MSAVDLFGPVPEGPSAPFRDIRNQRESVASQKAELVLQLRRLATTCPREAGNWSPQKVTQWDAMRKKALKAVASQRASVPELLGLVSALSGYFG